MDQDDLNLYNAVKVVIHLVIMAFIGLMVCIVLSALVGCKSKSHLVSDEQTTRNDTTLVSHSTGFTLTTISDTCYRESEEGSEIEYTFGEGGKIEVSPDGKKTFRGVLKVNEKNRKKDIFGNSHKEEAASITEKYDSLSVAHQINTKHLEKSKETDSKASIGCNIGGFPSIFGLIILLVVIHKPHWINRLIDKIK